MKNVVELTETGFETEVRQAPGLVLVDFYAPWCGPCRMLAPLLDQLAAEFAGRIKFAKVNVDHAPTLAEDYQITGVPALLLFRNGQPVDQWSAWPRPKPCGNAANALTANPQFITRSPPDLEHSHDPAILLGAALRRRSVCILQVRGCSTVTFP